MDCEHRETTNILRVERECPKCGYPVSVVTALAKIKNDSYNAGLQRAVEIIKDTAKDVWTRGTAGYPTIVEAIEKEINKGE